MGKRVKSSKNNNNALVADDDHDSDVDQHGEEYGITVGGSDPNGPGDGNSRAGGSGGMSRAAKKRAKKRAKKEPEPAVNDDIASGKKEKMQLPFDDDEDADGYSDAEEDLFGASKQFLAEANKKQKKSKEDKTQQKKKKKKGGKESSEADTGATPKKKKSKETKDVIDEEEDNAMGEHQQEEEDDLDMEEVEMEPELEAMLSSLTPLQILMLDGNSTNLDSKVDGADHGDDATNTENKEPKKVDGGDEEDQAMLMGGVDPLMLVQDLTTEHRARILLSSLLCPSGVTTHEFYNSYWGKRPLLAAFDGGEDDDDEEEGKGKKGKNKTKINPTDGNFTLNKEDEALLHATRLDGFLNRSIIHQMIRRNKLRYGLDLNVTKYTDTLGNGLRHRITLDPPPKKRKNRVGSTKNNSDEDNSNAQDDLEYVIANPQDIWSNIDASHCTLRLLRPHEHNDPIHTMLSLLESEFGCMVGSNAYLTPLHSQGFAPHYDDVDVFILQLEGYKRWRVYAPANKLETLPRQSSRDYTEKEVEEDMGCELLMDVVIGPGDVLYLPRGWIHQAETVARPSHILGKPPKSGGKVGDDDINGPGGHSLHLTVSAMQNWTWADFLEILMPEALESAATSDKSTSLREGLPRNFLSYMGAMHQLDDDDEDGGTNLPEGIKQAMLAASKLGDDEELDDEAMMEAIAKQKTKARQHQFKDEAKKRIMRVCKQAMSMLDDACDQIGKRFLSDRLPPALLEPEASLTKDSGGTSNHHDSTKKIWPNTLCRLVRPNIARLVIEESKAILYHSLDNSRVYQGTPLSPMEFEIDDAPALEQLLTTVEPRWIQVKDLIHGDVEDKMEIAQALYDEGILATMLAEAPDRSVQTG